MTTQRRRARLWAAALMLAALPAAGRAQPETPSCPGIAPLAGDLPRAGQLHVRFIGTSTLLFDDGATQILIDGYFSRPSLLRAAIGRVRPNQGRIDGAMHSAGIGKRPLKAIFVAHSHIDHALDAPEIAASTGADLIGSPSVAQIAAGRGLQSSRVKVVRGSCKARYGNFDVTIISTPHSTPNIARGDIGKAVPARAWAQRYRAGSSHAYLIEHKGQRLLVYPSSAYRPGLLKELRADVVFLGIAGLGRKRSDFVDAYWAEVVESVGGRLVYPIHWDNFGKRLKVRLKPMPWPFDNVARGWGRVARLACAHDVRLEELPLFTPVQLRPLPPRRPRTTPPGIPLATSCPGAQTGPRSTPLPPEAAPAP